MVVGGGSAAPSGTTALLPLNYRLTENDARRKTTSGTHAVVEGGSTALSGTTALLPYYYRLAENDTSRKSASGSCSGSRGRKYRTKRYYRSAELYYRPERYYRTTTAQLPDNEKRCQKKFLKRKSQRYWRAVVPHEAVLPPGAVLPHYYRTTTV